MLVSYHLDTLNDSVEERCTECRGNPLPIRSHGPSPRSHDHVLQGLACRGLLLRVLAACGALAVGGRRSAAARVSLSPLDFSKALVCIPEVVVSSGR